METNAKRLEPAASILQKLGGPTAVADYLGIHRTWPWKWQQPREKHGTGGLVPQKYHPQLLDLARLKCVPMTAADFLPPRRDEAAA